MLKVLQHEVCTSVITVVVQLRYGRTDRMRSRPWCRSVEEPRCARHGKHTHAIEGRERQATSMRQGSLGRQKSEYVKPYTQRRAKLLVLSVTSLCKGQDGSPSRIAYLMTFESSNYGRSKPPEDSLRRPLSPLIEELKVSIAKRNCCPPVIARGRTFCSQRATLLSVTSSMSLGAS